MVVTAFAVTTPLEVSLLIFIAVMPLTTVAAFNLGDNSVLIYHLVWLVVALRIVGLRTRARKPMRYPFLPFLLFALGTTPLALLNSDMTVIGVDGNIANVAFSLQQYAQLVYLAMAISTAWIYQYALEQGVVSLRRLMRAVDAGLVLVVIAALLQLVVPADVVTSLYRNSLNVGFVGEGDRISSTFNEPSMLSLYLVPLLVFKIVGLTKKFKLLDFIFIALGLLVCFLNNSSSAFLGLAVAFAPAIWILLTRGKKLLLSPTVIVLLCVVGVFATVAISSGMLDKPLSSLLFKLAGEGESGGVRSLNLNNTIEIFFECPLIGIGWGTIRCESLLASWLAMMGVVGVILFAVPVVRLLGSLFRGDLACLQFGCYLVIALVILAVSVPEPYYLTLWMMVGVAEHLAQSRKTVAALPSDGRAVQGDSEATCMALCTDVPSVSKSAPRVSGVHAT